MAFSVQDSDEIPFEISVAPLVDVVLVLLVVFIITVLLLTNSIPIDLPRTESVTPSKQKDPPVVNIDGAGKLFVNRGEIQPELLRSNLAATKARGAEVHMQLQADEGVNYGQVAEAMVSTEHAGITRLAAVIVR